MYEVIKAYADIIIKSKFKNLSEGHRNQEASKAFRQISKVIRDVTFDDDHDEVVFHHLVEHYGHVSEIRTQRINQALSRLPVLLKVFLYTTSGIAIATFVLMPFANIWYGFFATGAITFIVSMVYHLVEDLDNPFKGYWTITPEPFERALRHIEKDY